MPRSATALIRLLPAPDAAPADAPLLRAFLSAVPAVGEAAFAELVRRHGPLVLAACRRVLGNPHDAEDAFQGTFLVLARKAGTIRGNLAGWLYMVAVRTARGVRVMRDRRRKHETRAAANGLEKSGGAGCSPSDTDLAAVIDEELAKLPDHYREAIVLCELRGLGRKQAATELGIPEGTLSSRLAGAKRRLAGLLSARGLAAPTALVPIVAPAEVSAGLLCAAVSATRGMVSAAAGSAAGAVMKGMLFDQIRAVVVTAGIVLTVACGGWAMTGTPGGDHPASAPASRVAQDPVALLIAQLGAPEFADREGAQKALRSQGLQAETAIKAGLKADNPEIRDRCAKLLSEIRADARDALAKNFNPSAADDYSHPLWKRFSAIAGNTRASRELFAQIIRNPNWLRRLDAVEAGPATAAQHYREAIMEVGKLFNYCVTVWFHVPLWPCDRGDEVAYLLLLGSYPNSAPDLSVLLPKDARQFATGEGRIPLARGLELGLQGKFLETFPQLRPDPAKAIDGTDRVFARLFSAWLPQRRNPDVLWGAFLLAAAHGASDVLPFARRAAADRSLPIDARCYALMPIARLGTPADRSLFEVLFADETVIAVHDGLDFRSVAPPGAKPVKPIGHVQARDYAAAHLLLLFGENPSDYGFIQARKRVVKRGERLNPAHFLITEFAFPTDDNNKARDAAHAKVKAFLDKQSKVEPKTDEPDVTKLVELLGAAEFAVREAAQKALAAKGSKARAALLTGLKAENPEVAKRCRELLDQLAWAEFEARHWTRFAKVVGDGKEDRELFARIRSLKRNVELLNAVVADPDSAGKLYHHRWKELNNAARTPNGPGGFILSAAPLADVVGWMYLGTFPGAEGSFHQSFSLDFLPASFYRTSRDPLPLALQDKTASPALRRLIGKWTAARTDYSGREFGFQLAVAYDIAEVLPAARETLKATVKDDPYPGNTARNVARAMLVVGKLGARDDLPLLERYAKDETHCATFLHDPPPKPGQPVLHLIRPPIEGQDTTSQLRDVSAAMRLHLCGQKPQEFGFYWKWPFGDEAGKQNSLGTFNLYAIGFLRDTDRAAAHQKAGEWLAKQKKEEPDSTALKLIEQLGAAEFADREAAQKALRSLGPKAEVALKSGLQSDNPEVVKSCKELLDAIRSDLLGSKQSPVWMKFKTIAGDDAEAWKLYLRMIGTRQRAGMLLDAVNDPKKAAASYAKECEAIGKVMNQGRAVGVEPPQKPPGFPDREVTSDDIAALLLVGGIVPTTRIGEKGELNAVINHVLVSGLIGETKGSFGKLYAAWAEPRSWAWEASFNIALTERVTAMTSVVRKALTVFAANKRNPSGKEDALALRFLGWYGTIDDIPLILKFADNKTACGRMSSGGKKDGTVVQVRDLAVIAALTLRKARLQDFGFGMHDIAPPWPANFLANHGFDSDADRAAAHKKAWEWLAKQK